jgi:threonine aldolase
MKYSFYDDYSEGVAPELLDYIASNNTDQQRGYCTDDYCVLASERIRAAFDMHSADVHYLPNGTVANVVGLVSMLKAYEGVISVKSGHINTHEAGALEATGHKILWVDSQDGKLNPELIEKAYASYEDEHTVRPKVVYITQPSELGTLYSLDELRAVVDSARSKGMYIYMDGARLAMALASPLTDIRMKDYGCIGIDMFYIGGTKNGGLYGEAMVILNKDLKSDFRYHIKQRGALMAKSRFMGQQFARFFDEDDLYMRLAVNATSSATKLAQGLHGLGVEITENGTNQLFPVLHNDAITRLSEQYGFYIWEKISDTQSRIRLVTSWATSELAVDELLSDLTGILAEGE